MSDGGELEKLRARVRRLEEELTAIKTKDEARQRRKILTMSAEVVDTNPYR